MGREGLQRWSSGLQRAGAMRMRGKACDGEGRPGILMWSRHHVLRAWLRETLGAEIVTVTVDTGGFSDDELRTLERESSVSRTTASSTQSPSCSIDSSPGSSRGSRGTECAATPTRCAWARATCSLEPWADETRSAAPLVAYPNSSRPAAGWVSRPRTRARTRSDSPISSNRRSSREGTPERDLRAREAPGARRRPRGRIHPGVLRRTCTPPGAARARAA